MAITVSAKTRVTVASGAVSMGSYTVATDDYAVFPICTNTNFSGPNHVLTKTAGTATIGTPVVEILQQSGGAYSLQWVKVTAGGTVTFSLSNPDAVRTSCAPLILTGVDTTTPKNVEAQGGSTTNAINVGATSTVAACAAVVGGTCWNDLGDPTSSDLTNFTAHNGAGGSMSGGSGWKTVAAAGAFTGNLDAAGAGAADWDWGVCAFAPSTGGAVQLVVQNATHAHTAANTVLTQHQVLVVAGATHAHTAANVALTQHQVLVVANATHGHTAAAVVLTQHQVLAVANATHAHTAAAVVLTQHQVLTVAGATHAHSSANTVLTQHQVLVVANATHGHSVESVVVVAHDPGGVVLVVANATHGHTAAAVTLTQHHVLELANATHAHTAGNVVLLQHFVLVVANAVHAHTVGNIVLFDTATVLTVLRVLTVRAEDRTYRITAEDRTLTVAADTRTLTVPADPDRDLTIPTDDRTLLVEAP